MLKTLPLILLLIPLLSIANEQHISFSLATAELPPYVFLDQEKNPQGIFIDWLKEVEQNTTLKINVYVLPWARALSEVENNRIDALMPALMSEQRKQFLVYPQQPFFSFSDSVLIKRVDDNFTFTELVDISSNKIIGKTRRVMIDNEFDSLVKMGYLKIFETSKLDEALMMLQQKKLDLVASDGDIATSTIKSLDLDNQFNLIPLHSNPPPSFIAFAKPFAKSHDIDAIMQLIMQYKPIH